MKKLFFILIALFFAPALVIGQNMLANPGFEDGTTTGWLTYGQTGASMQIMNDGTAHSGSYWAKCTSTQGGYYLLYQLISPAGPGEIWKFSSFIKDVSASDPGGDYAALKITANSAAGSNLANWEVFQDGVDTTWQEFANEQMMPLGTAKIQAVLVTHVLNDTAEASYGYDDVSLEKTASIFSNYNYLANSGFEDGTTTGWLTYGQTGATLEIMNDGTAYSGTYWAKCNSTVGGYYLLYQKLPAKEGELWRFRSFIKDVSPADSGRNYVALKITAKDSLNANLANWEVFQAGMTSDWQLFWNEQTMPFGTAYIQAVLVTHALDDTSVVSFGFDDVSLEVVHEITHNPGFEDGDSNFDGIPDYWLGWAQSDTYIETVNDANAHTGDYWLKMGVDAPGSGKWAITYWPVLPAQPGEVWSLRSFIKDVSADTSTGDFAFLKIAVKNANQTTFQYVESYKSATTDWQDFSYEQLMPLNTAYMQATLGVKKSLADGIAVAYGFDDVRLVNLGILDNTPPSAPTSVSAIVGPIDYTNEVVWLDVAGEDGETYTVYASQNPITNIHDLGVDLLASGIAENVQSYVHRINYPLVNNSVTWYYAVTATDAANNVGDPGFSSAFSNTAQGIATISLIVPSNFQADGDISEWYGLGVKPIKMKPEVSHTGTGVISDSTDLSVTGYVGVDDDYLYLSFDVIDDIYSYDPASTYWKSDMMYLYIGLYNHTEKHLTAQRGAEPDYIFHFVQTHLRSYYSEPTGNDTLYLNGDPNYAFVDFGAQDYVVEAKISLDDILRKNQAGDTRFHPANGMRIAIDIEFADSDQLGVRDGLLVYSWDNNNTSYLGPATWSYTWIGDTTHVTGIGGEIDQTVYSYELSQNYPNPFNPTTEISYSLAKTSDVSLIVYNVLGQEVTRLVKEKQNPGKHSVTFNANNLSTGVYFYRIEADGFAMTRKMLLMK